MAFSRNFSSVTTPPGGISSRDSSNCGLIRIRKSAFSSASEMAGPSTLLTEIKETSITTTAAFWGSSSPSSSRAFRSIRKTRGSCRSFQSICSVFTSTAKTREAPCCKRQSVNPPVEEPMSRQIRPLGSIAKSASAPFNLTPPRLTNCCARFVSSICASAAMGVPALSVRLPSTWTSPARTMARASFKDPAIPRSTRRISSRLRIALGFMAFETSGAAKNEEFRNFTKPRSTLSKGREFSNGLRREIVGNGVRAFEAVHGRIGRLFLRDVLASGFSERGRRLLDVQDVVGNLKCPADGLSKAAKARDVVFTCAGAQSARGDGSADERSCFRAMNVFKHLRLDAPALCFDVSDLAAHHSIHGPRGCSNFRQDGHTAFRSHGCSADGLERQRQKRIARKNGDGFAELLMARRFASAKIVIVESRQVVMNQRISVDEFDGASRIVRRRDVAVKNARRLNAKNGTDPLAACKDAVPHCRMNGRRRRRLRGQQPLEGGIHGKTVFLEKGRKFHRGGKLAHGRQRGCFTIHLHVRDQTVRQQACRQLF